MGDQKSKFYFIVNSYQENGKTIVVYTSKELATLDRLPGANREMSDEEITAAALADPDTVSPLKDDIFLTGKRGREALVELFPREIAEGGACLAPRTSEADSPKRVVSAPQSISKMLCVLSVKATPFADERLLSDTMPQAFASPPLRIRLSICSAGAFCQTATCFSAPLCPHGSRVYEGHAKAPALSRTPVPPHVTFSRE